MPNGESGTDTLRRIADAMGIGVEAFFTSTNERYVGGADGERDKPLDRRLLEAFTALPTDEARLRAVRIVEALAASEPMSRRRPQS